MKILLPLILIAIASGCSSANQVMDLSDRQQYVEYRIIIFEQIEYDVVEKRYLQPLAVFLDNNNLGKLDGVSCMISMSNDSGLAGWEVNVLIRDQKTIELLRQKLVDLKAPKSTVVQKVSKKSIRRHIVVTDDPNPEGYDNKSSIRFR